MQDSQRVSAASSIYDYHDCLRSPPHDDDDDDDSATSSDCDTRSSSVFHPSLNVSLPEQSSSSRQVQHPEHQPNNHYTPPRPTSALPPGSPKQVPVTLRPASIDSPRSAPLPNHSPLAQPLAHSGSVQTSTIDESPSTPSTQRFSTQRSSIYSLESSGEPTGEISDRIPSPSSFPLVESRPDLHSYSSSVSDYEQPAAVVVGDQPRDSAMSASKPSSNQPHLAVKIDSYSSGGDVASPDVAKQPKSPGVSGFFGWKRGATNQTDSPTTISDSKSASPVVSTGPAPPMNPSSAENPAQEQPSSPSSDDEDYFVGGSYYGSTSPQAATLPPAEELLRELREVSAELAASIRREMELEDEVDRYRSEMPTTQVEHHRRGSDYYSDSGASSARLIPIDSETKMEGLEKMRRKAEQEKAQLKLDMAERSRHNTNHIKGLELHVKSLEEQLQSGDNYESMRQLEDVKRKLTEERQFKDNFDELLGGMRQEIEAHRNERDNLRDEVIPQMRARIEGLEAQSMDTQTLTYENSRLQQELQNTKNENEMLNNARRLQQEGGRFRTISEEGDDSFSMSPVAMGMGRSNSLKRAVSMRGRSNSLTKSRDGSTSQDYPAEGVKALEDQRDALHRALKNLILRHETMAQNHAKQIRSLEAERDKALNGTPRRTALQFEVQQLRGEVDHLRHRADEALEQKWQSEKGLSSLKMDLDRAQQETSSLRALLQDKDTLSTETKGIDKSSDGEDALDAAYADLKMTHAHSIARLQAKVHNDGDQDAHQLIEISRNRMRGLSKEVESQIALNEELRDRLGEAVERGVREQQSSAKKIADLETALRAAEEQVVAATNVSEDAVSRQEEYVKTMRDAADEQTRRGLSRKHNSKRISIISSATALNSPLLASKSPRLNTPSTFQPTGAFDATKTDALERRVRDLEEAAIGADREMQNLIEKMSQAQMEVAELETERDESLKQTRRLQREIVEERERIKAVTV